MKKSGVILFVLFIILGSLKAQTSKPLMIINGEEISAEEFMQVFLKNSTNKAATKEEIDEYLDLYINFRLKVAEAKVLQLDTQSTFKNELAGYRRTLAQPYLTKTEILDKLMTETYSRMQWDLRASHILIKVSPNASPADTLAAYKKAIQVRNRALKGESFEKLVFEFSEDESAKGNQNIPGNKGDLGYFSAMDLVYEFENAAYSMKTGEISMPVRSEYGYHIIKLTEKRPSLGRVQTAHILITVAPDASAEQKKDALDRANNIYDRIMKGESYEELAKQYSDDKGSGMRGGSLPWFGVFRMLPEFIEPLYSMEKNDVTKPILTSYGYHVVKLLEVKKNGTFDEMKNDLKSKIMRDRRYQVAIETFVRLLKDENGFIEHPEVLRKFSASVNNDIYDGAWKSETAIGQMEQLFKIGDRILYVRDFAMFLELNQNILKGDDKTVYITNLYNKFVNEQILNFENDNLEKKYPQFAILMKEYYDGILLFDLTDKMVWSKALRDTTGLNEFYKTISHNYMWPIRVEGSVFYCNDADRAKRFHKELTKAEKKGWELDLVMEMFNTPEVTNVHAETGIFIKEGHPYFGNVSKKGISKPFEKDGKYVIVKTDRIIQPEPKAIREVKGVVTNEYQNYLEREWIKELRAKYKWYVNEEVLKTLYR